jgi:DNA-binding NarL/FixJ family response regulator
VIAASRSEKISVLLLDDHAVVREGYRRLLEKRGDIGARRHK